MSSESEAPPLAGGLGALLRSRAVWVLAVLAVVAVAATIYAIGFRKSGDPAASATVAVAGGPLVISVAESGTIQNRERVVIKSEVEGTSTILYLVSEGTRVNEGDLLVELDASRLVESKGQQQITVMNSEAGFIRARETLAVTKSQTDSDIAQAELTLKFAKLDLIKYQEGDHPREVQKAEADINVATEELRRAVDKVEWSRTLAEKGYISQSELQADELAVKRCQIDLDLANSAMALLAKYTHQRNLDQFTSNQKQATDALERAKRKAAADLVQAEADLKAKESEYERQKVMLDKADDQISKCRITAPVGGLVVYATTGQGGFRGNVEPMAEGQQVRERQELIHLPTTAAMMAEMKVHEASLGKVRRDLPVRVTVDAVPGVTFWGRVGKIGLLPDAQSAFLNPDLKVYSTQIYLDGDASMLRAGMSCRAEIIVEQYTDALYVPVQAVVRVGGKSVVYLPSPRGPQLREVEVGMDNNRVIRIISGLTKGQQVVLDPPLAPSELRDQSGGESPAKLIDVPAATTRPAGGPAATAPASQPAIDLSKLRNMSPEERQKFLDTLTPEQREQVRARGSGRRPAGSGGGGASNPGGTGGGPP